MLVWLLQNTVLAGLLAIGLALLCRWKRCTPAMRHALWLLVMLRLAIPPGVMSWPWTVPLPSLQRAEEVQTAAAPAKTFHFVIDHPELEFVASESEPPAAAETPKPAEAVAAPIDWSRWIWRTTLGFWLAGAIVVAIAHLRGFAQLYRLMRQGETAPPWLSRRVGELAGRLGIRPPRVRVLDDLASPLVVGFMRPVLLWPRDLQDRLNEDGLQAVLLHELAHLRRRDHWVRWLEMAAACVWWWNPLFRLARRRIRQYAELACDAWVLAVLPKARRAYAEALLQVCESVTRTTEPAPALGVGGDRDDFQRRLTMIMRESVACRLPRKSLLAIGVLALLVVPGWSLGDGAEENAAPAAATGKPLGVLLDDDLNLDVGVLNKLLQTTADGDRDKKLEELESQIQAILKEIKALKQESAKAHAARAAATEKKLDVDRATAEVERARAQAERALVDAANKWKEDSAKRAETLAKLKTAQARLEFEHARKALDARRAQEQTETTLTRIAYTLPHEKAMALATFLRDFARTGLSECSVEGDRLTVTAQPGTQQVIGRLVRLVTPKGAGQK